LNNHVAVAVIDSGISPDRLENPVILPGINLSGEGEVDDTTDSGNHGTAVAKTILSIAPQTWLVPIRLMNRRGSLRNRAKVEEAFAWTLDHRESFGIQIICAAFADFSHATSDAEHRGSRLQQQIAALREMNVATVAPAGNWHREFRRQSPQGMAWPAIIQEAISVGALQRQPDGLWLTHETQRLNAGWDTACHTTVFTEPGDLGDTSGAAAVITGCLAVLRQSYPEATPNELVQRLLRFQQNAYDESDFIWPALDAKEVLARLLGV
jgi:subtilisin family serine protease